MMMEEFLNTILSAFRGKESVRVGGVRYGVTVSDSLVVLRHGRRRVVLGASDFERRWRVRGGTLCYVRYVNRDVQYVAA